MRNAVTHGGATHIVLTAEAREQAMALIVNDNGRGLPVEEHGKVLGRFARGSTAVNSGSGLEPPWSPSRRRLHDGTIELSDGPLCGLRATLKVSSRRETD